MPIDHAILLTPNEARVLGALLEKEATTPDYYPLSLNALQNACNQRSNREPVMDLDEEAIRQALHRLEDLGLAGRAGAADGRVARFEHRLGEAYNFIRAESALICTLLLRGAQTPGELRARSERLFAFGEIAEVIKTLRKLAERMPPLAAMLPRQPGAKEVRYTHLFFPSAPPDSASPVAARPFHPATDRPADRVAGAQSGLAPEAGVAHLEARLTNLELKLDALQRRFDDLFAG